MMVTQQRQRWETVVANLPRGMKTAIVELAIAHDYACDVECDPWQFAVEISRLMELGLTASDLRWLVEKGYVTHAREVTQPSDLVRRFAPAENTAFSQEARFLLTDAGLSFAGSISPGPTLLRFRDRVAQRSEAACMPRWERKSGTLYVGQQVVKRFMRPSPNQEIVLTTFEEEGWPDRIDDPLPPARNVAPKRRLHDTIKWLNRNQELRLLHFSGDGTGEGICWKALVPAPR